jgi:hypothetical protein
VDTELAGRLVEQALGARFAVDQTGDRAALDGEITDHLGYEKHDPASKDGGNSGTAPGQDGADRHRPGGGALPVRCSACWEVLLVNSFEPGGTAETDDSVGQAQESEEVRAGGSGVADDA